MTKYSAEKFKIDQIIKIRISNDETRYLGMLKGDEYRATIVEDPYHGQLPAFLIKEIDRIWYLDGKYFDLVLEDDLEPAMS